MLRNAAQSFQRLIDQVLRGLLFVYTYIDDLLLTPEEHKGHLQEVLKRLGEHGIVTNPANCVLGVLELDFLGHKVTAQGIAPLEDKVRAVLLQASGIFRQ